MPPYRDGMVYESPPPRCNFTRIAIRAVVVLYLVSLAAILVALATHKTSLDVLLAPAGAR